MSDDEAAQLHASAAITQPIKIPNEARSAILAGGELDANAAAAADAELTRRAFAATDMVVLPSPKSADGEPSAEPQGASDWSPGTTKPQRKLLNASKPGSEAGRYSVQGSTVDYVESNTASKPAGVWSSARPSDPEPSGSWGVVPDPNATWGATADASDAGASWNPAPDEDPNARARRYTPKQRPAQRGRRAPTIRGQGDRPESMTTLPDRPRSPAALRSTVPGRPALARPSPLPAAPVASLPSSVRVDPSASIPSPPAPQRTAAGRPASPANYEPLPRDRESFEAYMRNKRAAETSPPHARSNWKEQETLLIPRDSLPPEATRESLLGRMPWMRVAAVLAVVLMGSLAYWLRQTAPGGGPGPTLHSESPPQTERQSAPAAVMTLIATEPSGAELLLGGAVLGNTPFAVPRPTQGDETYLLRLRGFESQLVRLSPQSAGAIRVSLVPQATPTPASR